MRCPWYEYILKEDMKWNTLLRKASVGETPKEEPCVSAYQMVTPFLLSSFKILPLILLTCLSKITTRAERRDERRERRAVDGRFNNIITCKSTIISSH